MTWRRLLILVALSAWTSVLAGQAPREHTRLFPVVVNGRTGFIDSTGRMVIAPRFEMTRPFTEGLAAVTLGGVWGYIDTTGAMVIEPRFDHAGEFSEHLAWVIIGDHRGFIDSTGRIVIAPRFDVATGFIDRRAQVMVGRTFGYIDHTGKLVIQTEFHGEFGETLDFSQGLAAVLVHGQWGYIDTTGTMVIAPRFRVPKSTSTMGALRFSEGRAAVPLGAKWGYIDRTGRVVIEPHFDQASYFEEGLAPVKVGTLYGYIDTAGTMVIAPQFVLAAGFSEGLAAVRDSAGSWGYIDRTGKMVLAPQWWEADRFRGGLACVRSNGQCEYIDHTGRYVWRAGAVAVAARVPAPPDTTPLEGTGSLVDRVSVIVDRAEAAEAGQQVDRAIGLILQDAAKAARQLTTYLDSHPNDVRALILSARLGRLGQIAQPLVIQRGDTLPTFASLAADYAPHQAALNRALALEPNNAEAYYWKGRLYGLGQSWMGMLYGITAPPPAVVALARAYGDSAVRYARRAVELEPERLQYRVALAIHLILAEQEQEAATVLRDVAAGRHPMSVLLADWQAIPVPTGAVSLPERARGLTRMMTDEEAMSEYPFLRVHMYVVVMQADSVEAFYRRRWPGFRLIRTEEHKNGDLRVRVYSQYLRWQGGQIVTARDKREIPDEPTEGIAVALMEIVNPPAEVRQQYPVPLGSVFCLLTFINMRRFAAR